MDQCETGSNVRNPEKGFLGKCDNDVDEDPIIRAMRMADALDRETESLQPPNYDVDLASESSRSSRSRPRSTSWSVMEFAVQLREPRTGLPIDAGDGYPVFRIQSPAKRKRSRCKGFEPAHQGKASRTLLHQVPSGRGSAAENTNKYAPTLGSVSRWSTRSTRTTEQQTPTLASRPSWSPKVPIRTSSRDAPTMLTNSLEKFTQDSSQSDDDDGVKLFTDHNGTPQIANLAVDKPYPPMSPLFESDKIHFGSQVFDSRPTSSLHPQSHSAVTSRTFGVEKPTKTAGSTMSKTSSAVTTTEGTMSSEMIIAIGVEDGVSSEFLTQTIDQIEALAPKELIANAMQSFTTLPLIKQMEDNPFTNRSLLAQLMVPHVEAYFLLNSHVRLLIIDYPADHLSTILSLQALVGSNSMAVAGILNEDDHALSRCSTPLANSDKPVSAASSTDNLALPLEAKFPGPPTSFAKANYLVTASATDSEMTSFLASIRDFYLSEDSPRKDRKRRRVKPEEAKSQQPRAASASSKTSSNPKNYLNLRLDSPHHGFSSSSNLATPPISPTDPTATTADERSSFSPSTTTTHLYLQPVSPESLEFGNAGPNSKTVEKMKNPGTIVFKAVSPTEMRRPNNSNHERNPRNHIYHQMNNLETLPKPKANTSVARKAIRRKPLPSNIAAVGGTRYSQQKYSNNNPNSTSTNTNTNLILFGDDDEKPLATTTTTTSFLPSYQSTTASFSSSNLNTYTDSEDEYASNSRRCDQENEIPEEDSVIDFGIYHSSPTTRCERCGSPNYGRKEEKFLSQGGNSKTERVLGMPPAQVKEGRDRKAMKLLGLE
ncbi:hypothetical protein QBC37DRAFT_401749 [Rhypophila decipiens]|uniref:Uncharacterized protein n=1 Tax=Rhypophila decipiens TaxID=261697 RepID=A0AAN7B6T7_9PEZI|nr:hypothetical protein QBC37DRAFT_401749 [Rhypophila decipiens]